METGEESAMQDFESISDYSPMNNEAATQPRRYRKETGIK